jgi:hypothetical protein
VDMAAAIDKGACSSEQPAFRIGVLRTFRAGALPRATPPLSPARGPPQPDLDFDAEHTLDLDQTPALDPAEPEPDPDRDLDRSRGGRAELRLPAAAHSRSRGRESQPWSQNDLAPGPRPIRPWSRRTTVAYLLLRAPRDCCRCRLARWPESLGDCRVAPYTRANPGAQSGSKESPQQGWALQARGIVRLRGRGGRWRFVHPTRQLPGAVGALASLTGEVTGC